VAKIFYFDGTRSHHGVLRAVVPFRELAGLIPLDAAYLGESVRSGQVGRARTLVEISAHEQQPETGWLRGFYDAGKTPIQFEKVLQTALGGPRARQAAPSAKR